MAMFQSQEDLAQNQQNTPMEPIQADSYIAKVVKVEKDKPNQSFDSSQKRGRVTDLSTLPPEEITPIHNIEMLIYGCKSGDPIRDMKNEVVPPLRRRAWKSFPVHSVGFNKDNEPSHHRAFLAYGLKKDVYSSFEGDVSDMEGEYIGVDIVTYKNQKGNMSNKVLRFTKVPESFHPDLAIELEAMAAYEESKNKKNDNDGSVNDAKL